MLHFQAGLYLMDFLWTKKWKETDSFVLYALNPHVLITFTKYSLKSLKTNAKEMIYQVGGGFKFIFI